MKRNSLVALALFSIIILMGACGNNAWDDVPSAITEFVQQYFPFGQVESYTSNRGTHTVEIKDGAVLVFDSNYQWTDINGRGQVLPQNFLYNELPESLYQYISAQEALQEAYRVQRTTADLKVWLLNDMVIYSESTHSISQHPISQ